MKTYYLIGCLLITALLGCTQLMRVDSDSYMKNQSKYKDTRILITANLEDVLENYKNFQDMDIEVTAMITHFEERDSPAWFLILEKNGKKLRGYEDDQRFIPPEVVYLARRAKKEGGEVTARGTLKEWGIQLEQLAYKNFIVSTNAGRSTA